MQDNSAHPLPATIATGLILWLLIAIYTAARFLQLGFGHVPMLAVVTLHVLPPALFALIHGALVYRPRGILIFFALCLVIGNIAENIGILTGFPYGSYVFTDVMGPKLFRVPILLGLAYVGMGYLSWTLGRIILASARSPLTGRSLFTVPLLASFIMVAWDLAGDPVWSTLVHAWIWRNGGVYFGVPVSNFLGWLLTVYLIYQSFALYLRSSANGPEPSGGSYNSLAVLFYGISAAGNLLLAIPTPGPTLVVDPSGATWKVASITGACALSSLFAMGPFTLLAWLRLTHRTRDTPSHYQKHTATAV